MSKEAESLFGAGRLAEAKVAFEEALENGRPDPRLLLRLGTLALYENRAEEAIRHLRAALGRSSRLGRRWPLSTAIRAQLAMAHYRLDRFPDASRELAAAAGPVPLGPFRQLAAFARQLAAFGEAPPYRIEGPALTRLQFAITDPLPVVELSVNETPPVPFLLDTGGAELLLDTKFATDVGAEMVAAFRGEYSGGKRARTGLGRVATVQAGEMRIGDVPVHALDMGPIADAFGIGVRGVLGTRVLMHFLATIDYPGGALILRRKAPEGHAGALAKERSKAIPFWLANIHNILARGRLNDGPPTFFWVDTGAMGKGFLASVGQLRAAGVPVDWSLASEGPGGGGMVKEADVVIDTLTLGEGDDAITQREVPGVAQKTAPRILGNRLGFEVGGLISHTFFRPYAVTLDFTNMRLVLD
jgi:Aspartyl protease